MNDSDKTHAELIAELQATRQKLANLAVLEQEIRHRSIQQRTLTSTAKAMLTIMNRAELWQAVREATSQTMGAQATAVYLYHPDHLQILYSHNLSLRYTAVLQKNSQQLPEQEGIKQKEPFIADDLLSLDLTNPVLEATLQEGFSTYAIFPFVTPEQIPGGLAIYHRSPKPLTLDEQSDGYVLSRMLGIALHNIQLFEANVQTLEREQQLNEVTRLLNSTPNLPTLLANVVQMATQLLQADAGSLGLVVDQSTMMFYPYNLPSQIQLRPAMRGHGIAWHIVETGESILLNNYAEHPSAQSHWVQAGIHGFIGVPVVAGDENLGSLGLFQLDPRKQFTPRDMDLAESVGRQAGTAIQNARLYTESKRRAEILAMALTKQEELDNLKNLFIQNVSHELRTPLGLIYGHAELLTSGVLGEMSAEQLSSVKIISRRAKMLNNIVGDLTALLAAESKKHEQEPVNMQELLEGVMIDFQIRSQELQIRLSGDIQPDLPWVTGDATQLRRVFDNLIANAFKFTPTHGEVVLRAWREETAVCLEVSDTGIGIPQDQLGRIFDRFYQVDGSSKRKFGGTGLGLALVKEIVQLHEGTVSVTSEEGKGATFRVWLPGYDPQPTPISFFPTDQIPETSRA